MPCSPSRSIMSSSHSKVYSPFEGSSQDHEKPPRVTKLTPASAISRRSSAHTSRGTAFQVGFCTFVLSNYMKTWPYEIYESAQLDGASVWRQYWQLTMPLVRPALAALATLQVTWIYNEFFWATVLLSRGEKYPVTSALNNLRGQFFADTNLVAAGSIIVALPVLIVFFVLQKQFVAGLTLGSTKG